MLLFTSLLAVLAFSIASTAINPTRPFHLVASTQQSRVANSSDLPDARPISILPDQDGSSNGYQPMLAGTGIYYSPAHSRFRITDGILHSPDCGQITISPPIFYTACNSTGVARGELLMFYNGQDGPQTPAPEQSRWSLLDGYLLAWNGSPRGFLTEDVDEKNNDERSAVFWQTDGGTGLGCRKEYGVKKCDRKKVFLHAYRQPFDD